MHCLVAIKMLKEKENRAGATCFHLQEIGITFPFSRDRQQTQTRSQALGKIGIAEIKGENISDPIRIKKRKAIP